MSELKGNPRSSGYAPAEHGWYVEPGWAVDLLLRHERLTGRVWDPCCGAGTIPQACGRAGLLSVGSDIVDRNANYAVADFLGPLAPLKPLSAGVQHILTNPPFSEAAEIVERGLALVPGKVIVLQRLAWLEGQKRRAFFERVGLSHVWVHSSRISMPPGGSDVPAIGGSVAYAWFVFGRERLNMPTLGWL